MFVLAARLRAAHRNQEENGRTDGFVLPATTSVRSLARFYGFTCPPVEKDLSIGDYVASTCGGAPQVGQRTAWGRAELVIAEISGRAISKVRLRLLPLRDRRMSFNEIPPRNPKRRTQDRGDASAR
jgi:NhaP-type Na+/H+ and K+/H+ antiporter